LLFNETFDAFGGNRKFTLYKLYELNATSGFRTLDLVDCEANPVTLYKQSSDDDAFSKLGGAYSFTFSEDLRTATFTLGADSRYCADPSNPQNLIDSVLKESLKLQYSYYGQEEHGYSLGFALGLFSHWTLEAKRPSTVQVVVPLKRLQHPLQAPVESNYSVDLDNQTSPLVLRLHLVHVRNDTSVTGSAWLDRLFYTFGLQYSTGTHVTDSLHVSHVETLRTAYLQDTVSRVQARQPDLVFEVAPAITVLQVHTGSFLDMVAKVGGMIALAIILSIIFGFINQQLFERKLSKQLKALKRKVHHDDEQQPGNLDDGFEAKEEEESDEALKVNLRQYFSF
jgi:hypothetical protein